MIKLYSKINCGLAPNPLPSVNCRRTVSSVNYLDCICNMRLLMSGWEFSKFFLFPVRNGYLK